MGFLHLGWDIAARDDADGGKGDETSGEREETSPAWRAVAAEVDLTRPGLAAVRRTMGWKPLHMYNPTLNLNLTLFLLVLSGAEGLYGWASELRI